MHLKAVKKPQIVGFRAKYFTHTYPISKMLCGIVISMSASSQMLLFFLYDWLPYIYFGLNLKIDYGDVQYPFQSTNHPSVTPTATTKAGGQSTKGANSTQHPNAENPPYLRWEEKEVSWRVFSYLSQSTKAAKSTPHKNPDNPPYLRWEEKEVSWRVFSYLRLVYKGCQIHTPQEPRQSTLPQMGGERG